MLRHTTQGHGTVHILDYVLYMYICGNPVQTHNHVTKIYIQSTVPLNWYIRAGAHTCVIDTCICDVSMWYV